METQPATATVPTSVPITRTDKGEAILTLNEHWRIFATGKDLQFEHRYDSSDKWELASRVRRESC
jgi:hypothetical protein